MAFVEDWMERAACARRPALGWLKDSYDVGLGEAATMAVVCARCPVYAECANFVDREGISGGFWAGEHRETYQEHVDGAA